MSKIKAIRYHDFCAGHRVVGHEGKCRHLHGHNYRVHFHCEGEKLDSLGRVIDFSVIKSTLCEWLEENWDHKFIAWDRDGILKSMERLNINEILESIVWVPFNPTAENLANHLLTVIAPRLLQDKGVTLTKVIIDETRKCSVSCEL